MNDRELLELAAKAADIEGEWVENSLLDDYYKLPTTGILMWSEGRRHIWNPITSSGDALRLAVKLNISIGFGIFATQINCEIYAWAEDEVLVEWKEDGRKDPCAATRRAIVRAAAEIVRNRGHVVTDKQTEALRSLYDITGSTNDKGTVLVGRAEPRRLYAENEDFRVTCDHLIRESAGQIGEIVALKEQRDELLEALQALTHSLDYADLLHDDQRKAFKHARSAIEKATGEKS